jgi:hypothetical protein
MGAKTKMVDTISDIFVRWGQSTAFQVATEFYTLGTALFGGLGRCDRIAANFNVNHAAKIQKKTVLHFFRIFAPEKQTQKLYL